MTPDAALQAFPFLYPFFTALLGLVVGSFLNVVILRLPVMMQRQWHRDCQALLANEEQPIASDRAPEQEESFSLAFPASRCPTCLKPIKAWQNIPVLSYLLMRGRCGCGEKPIGLRYPFVEALTAVATVVVALYATDWVTLVALWLLSWSLVALSGIDIDTQLLPDDITLPLLWAGLLFNLFHGPVPIADAVLGAAAGYLLLWSVYWLFRLVTGKEGMGFGDFKLLAALGAWLGWQSLPLIILLSSLVGACIGIALVVLRGRDRAQPLPFGPYLAAAGWITLLWGDLLMAVLFPTP